MVLLESYRFRFHVRRQIIELFPKHVLEEIVKDGMRDVLGHQQPEQTQQLYRNHHPSYRDTTPNAIPPSLGPSDMDPV